MYNLKSSQRTASRSWTSIAVWARALCPSFPLFTIAIIVLIDSSTNKYQILIKGINWQDQIPSLVNDSSIWTVWYHCANTENMIAVWSQIESINQSTNQSTSQAIIRWSSLAISESDNQLDVMVLVVGCLSNACEETCVTGRSARLVLLLWACKHSRGVHAFNEPRTCCQHAFNWLVVREVFINATGE